MVKVSMEVRSGAAHFDVGVQAQSIHRAVSLVKERYPKAYVQLKFPIKPEIYFVEDVAPQAEQIEFEEPHEKTAA
jgi:hypothetical protein